MRNPASGSSTVTELRKGALSLRILCVFEILLITATWPLWFVDTGFPQIPLPAADALSGASLMISVRLSQISSLLLLIVTATLAVIPHSHPDHRQRDLTGRHNAACGLAIATSSVLIFLNQHRLQPWHWLFLISCIARICFPVVEFRRIVRHIVSAVYLCSALSRITAAPADGIAGLLIRQMLRFTGIEPGLLTPATLNLLCHLSTLCEFGVGLLLLLPRTRIPGVVGAMLLHLTLLAVLGPVGLNHHAGVLLWNTCFLFLVPVLFLPDRMSVPEQRCESEITGRRRTNAAIAAMWLFSLSGLSGLADNWPSWQLYSPRPETWTLYVHESAVEQVPDSLRPFLAEPGMVSEWRTVMLDRWSLAATRSPMYPEDRFQRAVIRTVVRQIGNDTPFRVVRTAPDRLRWWRRQTTVLGSPQEI